mmetsp:Transcript_12008/g.48329  ORF Transcript_12008/g.48329 Transcript_12008/m.48329 type:complete len:201 (-) Transcript_12008:147-749(-)
MLNHLTCRSKTRAASPGPPLAAALDCRASMMRSKGWRSQLRYARCLRPSDRPTEKAASSSEARRTSSAIAVVPRSTSPTLTPATSALEPGVTSATSTRPGNRADSSMIMPNGGSRTTALTAEVSSLNDGSTTSLSGLYCGPRYTATRPKKYLVGVNSSVARFASACASVSGGGDSSVVSSVDAARRTTTSGCRRRETTTG